MGDQSWEERAAAGVALASRVDDPEVHAALLSHLLDPEDTAVTGRTAEALLAQRHPAAFRLLVLAGAAGDDGQRDWIAGSIADLVAADPVEHSRMQAWLVHLEAAGGEDGRAARIWAEWMGW